MSSHSAAAVHYTIRKLAAGMQAALRDRAKAASADAWARMDPAILRDLGMSRGEVMLCGRTRRRGRIEATLASTPQKS